MANSPVKRFLGTLLFLLALVVTGGFLFLVFADAENVGSVPLADQVPEVARVVGVGLGVVLLILAILILVRPARAGGRDDEDMFFIPEKDRVHLPYAFQEPQPEDDGPSGLEIDVYNLPSVARQEHAWDKPEQRNKVFPYYYPRSVVGALYTNDYIKIDHDGRSIKLRTLIAGPKGAQRADLPRVNKRHIVALKKQEQERQAAEEAAKVSAESVPGDGQEFMGALEERAARPQETTQVAGDEVFYGYAGENPGIDHVEGIDRSAASALKEAGVQTTARLLYEDPARLSRRTGYPLTDIARWQSIAELTKVPGIGPNSAVQLADAGVRGIADLKRRSANAIAVDVEKAGGSITAKRVEGWQEAARDLRRTKQRVPAS